MNERIKELSEHAEKWISTTNFEGMLEDNMTWDELYTKKFAELIMRETLRITGATISQHQTALRCFGVED